MKNNRLIYVLIVILAIWCIILTTTLNNTTSSEKEIISEYNITGISTDFTKIVDNTYSSIVTISNNGNYSTGFIYKQIDNNIYVLTSYHGVGETTNCGVNFASGYSSVGELVGYDVFLDLAVLRIESPYTVETLNLVDCSQLNSGEFVISIGTPISLEFAQSVEMGMISNSIRTIENSISVQEENHNYYLDVIQLSSNLKPGYSGSPVINMNGEVIGMTTMSLDEHFNFAVTSNEVKIVADKIINGNEVNKHQLGIKGTYIKDMPLFEKSNLNLSVDTIYGLYVNRIMENSICGTGDIKVGDVILNINGTDINNINDYLSVAYSETDSFEFEILRANENIKIKVDLND